MKRYEPLFETKEQEKTPEFKKWFGNSKVVDKSGNPLVVYHGTRKKFLKFKKSKEGVIWFAENKFSAEGFVNKFNTGEIHDFQDAINKYDGIIFKNGYDGIPVGGDIYVVFEPNQIKSAIGNRGTFNSRSDNILENLQR